MYTITDIKVSPRSIIKTLNNHPQLQGGLNEISISLNKEYKIFGLTLPISEQVIVEGVLHPKYNIHKYIKVGETFNLNKYPMLKIKSN